MTHPEFTLTPATPEPDWYDREVCTADAWPMPEMRAPQRRSAFWEGFWFGLNPLNSLACLRNMWRAVRDGFKAARRALGVAR